MVMELELEIKWPDDVEKCGCFLSPVGVTCGFPKEGNGAAFHLMMGGHVARNDKGEYFVW